MKILLMGEGYNQPTLNIEGASGVLYPFQWNAKRTQYEYEPKTQDEMLDIFRTPTLGLPYFFMPVMDLPSEYEMQRRFTAVETCKSFGIEVRDTDSAEYLDRLAAAFARGKAQATPPVAPVAPVADFEVEESAPTPATAPATTKPPRAQTRPRPSAARRGATAKEPVAALN